MSENEDMSQMLADLTAEIDKGFLEETYEVQGHKYRMRLLSDGENNWKARWMDAFGSALSILAQRKSATLAVSLKSIDEQDVLVLFAPKAPPTDAAESVLADYEKWSKGDALDRQFIVAKKIYNFLSQRPETFVTALYAEYEKLEKRRDKLVKNVKKS